jgi:translocation protein SEC63
VLTDETAFENFKKYGNPDGPGSYSVAIAMPKFLLEKNNQIPVLICAFFFLLCVIPGVLYINFGDTTIKDESGVLLENKKNYGAKLNEQLIPKNVPQILSSCIEF